MEEVKMRATREAYGDAILELGAANRDIYVIDCDVGKSCKTVPFSQRFPDQYVNVGIAEGNAAAMAAGLATCGKIPFVTTYAVFGSMRMCEQIRQMICYPRLNVKIACSHGGLTPANDGATHQGIEDMGIMRSLPNMSVVMGCDYVSSKKLIKAAAELYGPVYLRFTRDPVPMIYHESASFTIGKANTLRSGGDLTIIANGDAVCIALRAADILREKGVAATVLDMHTVKPIDREAVIEALARNGRIMTVEDHSLINGLGSAVSEIVAAEGYGRVCSVGIPDSFGESGPYQWLLEKFGITAENLVLQAERLMKK